jgi:Skp family chaperone for outer membrane proteins
MEKLNMKRNIVIITLFLFLSFATIATTAQTPPGTTAAPTVAPKPAPPQPVANVPATKIAIADTTVFGDEKAGIKRYINAVKTVEREFQPKTVELTNLQGRITAIADEITKLSGTAVVSQQTIESKQEEGVRLERELKYKKEQADADFAKRYKEHVGPISAHIGQALEQYANKNGLTMIIDISKLSPAVLTVNQATDITQAFIAEYNSLNP